MEILEAELRLFEGRLAEWFIHHEGKYALVKGGEIAGFFDTAENAYGEGVRRWGIAPFLIRQVLSEDPVEHIACA